MLIRGTCRTVLGALIKGSFSADGCLYIPTGGGTGGTGGNPRTPAPVSRTLTFNMSPPAFSYDKPADVNPSANSIRSEYTYSSKEAYEAHPRLEEKKSSKFIISTDTNPPLYAYATTESSILGDLALTENKSLADYFEFRDNIIYLSKNRKVLRRKNNKVVLDELFNVPVSKREELIFWKIENNKIYTYSKDKILYPVTVLDFKEGRTNTMYILTLSSNKNKDMKWNLIFSESAF
jgi:hypothetical protein